MTTPTPKIWKIVCESCHSVSWELLVQWLSPSGWALGSVPHEHHTCLLLNCIQADENCVGCGEMGGSEMSERAFLLLELFILLKVMHFHGNKAI